MLSLISPFSSVLCNYYALGSNGLFGKCIWYIYPVFKWKMFLLETTLSVFELMLSYLVIICILSLTFGMPCFFFFLALFDGLQFDVQKTARNGLHILLGGICALTIVVFFRFVSSFDSISFGFASLKHSLI